jgi:EmrB/QacA subfamily drug resistance transporter
MTNVTEQAITTIDTKKWLLPWVVAIAMFIDTLDSTIVSVAIPAIAGSFHINPVDMKLALTSYLLSLAVFIPISGWLADRFGEKKVFIGAMGIFTFSSILCALSTNLPFLILARMLQGFGGALMMPVGRLIMLRSFTKAEFGKAMGLVIIPGLLGPTLGPTIGGLILHVTSWHWIFLVNVPLGIIGIIVAYHLITQTEKQKSEKFNWSGFLLFSLGLAAITFAMAVLGDNFELRKYAAMLAVLAVILLTAYWHVSAKQAKPLLDIELFKQKTFRISMIVSLIARPSLGAIPFLIPLLLQVVWGKSALFSGMSFMFLALGMICARFILGQKLLENYGYKKGLFIIISAITIASMNLCWFSQPQPFIWLALMLFIIGLVTSQFYTSIGTMSVIEVEPKNFSQATSISSTTQQFSAGVGIAMAAILLHLISKVTHQPLFSADVFFWTIIILNGINFLSLFFIAQLNPNLKLQTAKK